MSRVFRLRSPLTQSTLCLLLVLFVSLSCGFRKPWRSYEQQPFDSQKWKSGDGITRGTMLRDLHGKRLLGGQTREGVVELLGEPDKKQIGRASCRERV